MARILVALALLLAPRIALAQDAQNRTAPKIRVSTRLVQIGVIVRDKQGPVDGLSKDEFAVFDRGKRQVISFFSVASSGAATWPAEQLPPNTFSDLAKYNPAAPGSITIVLLDNLNTLYGSAPTIFEDTPYWMEDHALANAKAHLLEYLRSLGSQDRVALYGLSDTLHVLSDFTTDRSRLLTLVEKYDVHSQTSREIVEPGATRLPQQVKGLERPPIDEASMEHAATANSTRATITLMAFKAIADHVANIPGRKNLVWLTANLPFSSEAIAAILSAAQIAVYPVDSRGLLPRSSAIGSGGIDAAQPGLPEQIRDAFDDPNRSSQPTGIDTMQHVADLTGGRAFANGNDLTGAIRDVVDDAAVLYSLGFYTDEHSSDGKFHELKVTVARSGVTVHYPKAYFASKDLPSTQNEVRNNLITAIRSPIESSAIPLEANIARVSDPEPDSLRITGSFDLHEVRLAEKGPLHEGAVDVIIVEQDAAGKVISQSANRLKLSFTNEKYASILNSGVHFEKHLQTKPEDVTLRILVEDPMTAQVGSLIIPLSAVK
jgi:VWFA-related protein